MKTTTTAILSGTCLAISLSAVASPANKHHKMHAAVVAPYELKGVKLGSHQAELKGRYPLIKCHDADKSQTPEPHPYSWDSYCSMSRGDKEVDSELLKFVGFPTPASNIHFVYKNDALVHISVDLPSDAFAGIAHALIVKYGMPVSEKKEHYQNGYGAQYTYQTMKWISRGQSITVHEYNELSTLAQREIFNNDTKQMSLEMETAGYQADQAAASAWKAHHDDQQL